MIAGVLLRDDVNKESKLAFLGDELKIHSLNTNEEIVEKLDDYDPEVIAFDIGTEQSQKEFTKDEKSLQDEGFIFTPNSHQEKKVERLQSLERFLKHKIDSIPEIIRFEPHITSKELDLASESELMRYGVEGEIADDKEFDAVLGAVTARFYQQGDYEDYGVIIPGKSGG